MNTWRDHRLVVLVGLLAALPVIVATGRAIHGHWIPSSDDGVIVLRAFDVFSAHSPLLGQWSQTSGLISANVYSLGPMLYWVLAVPAHIGADAVALTMGMISAAAVIGVVVMANRRGGVGFMFLTAAAMVTMFRSLPGEVSYEVWNCWAGLLPFVALIFLSWSVACGEVKLLPLVVLVASYVIQCHLTYLVPTLGLVIGAVAGLVLHRRRARRGVDGEDLDQREPRRTRREVLASVFVLVVCWCAPIIEQITHRPGNLVLAARLATSNHSRLGLHTGFWNLARAVGVVPKWLNNPPSGRANFDALLRGPSTIAQILAVIVVAGLITCLLVSVRGKRHDAGAAAALALTLCVSIILVAEALPMGVTGLAAAPYVLTWTSPAGMFVYLVLAWSVWSHLFPVASVRPAGARVGRLAGSAAILTLSVIVANQATGPDGGLPPRTGSYATIRAVTTATVHRLVGHDPALIAVAFDDVPSLTFESSIALEMRRRGIPVAVPPRVAEQMGAQYCPAAIRYPRVLLIADGGAPVAAGATLLAHSPEVTITLAQAPSGVRDRYAALARADRQSLGSSIPAPCSMTR